MAEQIKVTTKDDSNLVTIQATLTSGKVCAILNALENHGTPVAIDTLCLLRNAIYRDRKDHPESCLKGVEVG